MTEEDKKNAEIITLKSKNSKQRKEITRLTILLERVKREKAKILEDVNWMRGQTR